MITNFIVVVAISICESRLKIEPSKLVQYDRIELIKPEKRKELKSDIEQRLGLSVKRIEVGAVDLLRDMAVLRVYYTDDKMSSVNEKLKLGRTDLLEV